MEKSILKYRVNGKLFIWKYTSNSNNYPGWNLTVDDSCAKDLIELFELMLSSKYPSRKRVDSSLPTKHQLSVPNNKNANWKSAKFIEFSYKKFTNPNHWVIKEKDNGIIIQFGTNKLTELKHKINEIVLKIGDHAIFDKNEENILYFWWNNE